MSSVEGSETSNCNSQTLKFGLYKTIDARTEEFLKLSKKRQIKQGCACAVVTTVITVSVVIVIFFLCKYALESTYSKSSKNEAMNEIRNMRTNERIINDNFNVSAALVQLVPLLKKILAKKEYLNKFVDKITTPSIVDHKTKRTIKKRPKLHKIITTNPYKNGINTSDSSLFKYSKSWRESKYRTKQKNRRPHENFEKELNNLKNETMSFALYQKPQYTQSFNPKQKIRHSKVLDYINGITNTESNIETQSPTNKIMDTSCELRKKLFIKVLSKLLLTVKFLVPHVLQHLQTCDNGATQPFCDISVPVNIKTTTEATTIDLTTNEIISQESETYIPKSPENCEETTEPENHVAQRLISKKLRTNPKSTSHHSSTRISYLPKTYSPYKQRKTKKDTIKHHSFVNLDELWSKFKNTDANKIQPDKYMLKIKHIDSVLRGVKDVTSKKIQIQPPAETTKIYDLSNKLFSELENAIFSQQVHTPKKQKILSLANDVDRYKKPGVGDDQSQSKHTSITQNSPTFLDIMLTIANDDNKPQHKN